MFSFYEFQTIGLVPSGGLADGFSGFSLSLFPLFSLLKIRFCPMSETVLDHRFVLPVQILLLHHVGHAVNKDPCILVLQVREVFKRTEDPWNFFF